MRRPAAHSVHFSKHAFDFRPLCFFQLFVHFSLVLSFGLFVPGSEIDSLPVGLAAFSGVAVVLTAVAQACAGVSDQVP
jgi:drug/metabolite transporter (DMT)-like permease